MRPAAAVGLALLLVLLGALVFAGCSLGRAKGTTRLPFWDWRTYALLGSRAWHEPKARDLIQAVLAGPKRGLAVVDAGAWVGDLCIGVAEEFPGSAVHAVEPSKGLAEFVRAVGERNGLGNLTVHHAALSDQEGLQVSTSKENAPDASYQRAPDGSGTAETVTLDGLRQRGLPTLGLAHLDVEGSELDAVRGAMGCIASDRPFLLIETLRDRTAIDQITTLLTPLGYTSGRDVDEVCVFADWRDKNGCRNVLFVPSEHTDFLSTVRHMLQ